MEYSSSSPLVPIFQQPMQRQWVTHTGLVLPDDMPFELWAGVGAQLLAADRSVQWWLGDWLAYGERWYGETYTQAVDLTGRDYQSLANMTYVSKQVDFSRRREKLSWSHHAEVAPFEPDEQDTWLELAESEAWTRSELRQAIRTSRYTDAQRLSADSSESSRGIVIEQDAIDFLSGLATATADLLLTDPPYMTDVDDIAVFARSWVPLALEAVKPTGRAYICTGAYPEEMAAYLDVLSRGPLELRNILVWTYRNTLGPSPSHDYKLNWQAIFYLRGHDAPPLQSPLMTEQFSVQDINAPDGRLGDRLHAWQKPDELAERFIRHSTLPGHTVVDPFAGTGAFLAAAARLGRQGRGCDIDPKMLAFCEARGLEVRRA